MRVSATGLNLIPMSLRGRPKSVSARARWLLASVGVVLTIVLAAWYSSSSGSGTGGLALDGSDSTTTLSNDPVKAAVPTPTDEKIGATAEPETSRPAPPETSSDKELGSSLLDEKRGAQATLYGRVLDAATNEAVFDVGIDLAQGSRTEHLRSGTRGDFRTKVPYRAGDLDISVTDQDILIWHEKRSVDFTGEITLRIPIGPTLALSLPESTDGHAGQWEGRILEVSNPSFTSGALVAGPTGWDMKLDDEGLFRRTWTWRKVIGRDRPFIRYPTREYVHNPGLEAVLHLRNRTTGCACVVTMLDTVGRQGVFKIEPKMLSGAVRGTTSSSGSGFTTGLQGLVQLIRHESDQKDDNRFWRGTISDERGDFFLPDVAAGSYRLVIDLFNGEEWSQPVNVVAGETTLVEARVQSVDEQVNIELASSPSWPREPGTLFAAARSSETMNQGIALVKSESQGAQNRSFNLFVFLNVTRCKWDVSVIGLDRVPQVEPARFQISAPADKRDLELCADANRFVPKFSVLDNVSGRPVDDYRISLGGQVLAFGRRSSEFDDLRIPKGMDVTWSAWAIGCAPKSGTFETIPNPTQVRLARGWGVQIHCRGLLSVDGYSVPSPAEDDHQEALVPALISAPPLRDVVFGIETGATFRSDQSGIAEVVADKAPPALFVRYPGFEVFRLSRLCAETGQFILWMAPRDWNKR